MARERVVVGLDVGTTKVCTLIGEVKALDQLQVVGVGVTASQGLRKGLVVDMEEAAAAISTSLKKAETFSGYRIIGALVAVSGAHLDSELVCARLPFSNERTVSRQDLALVRKAAHPEDVPEGRHVLHVLPRGYAVDSENGIRNPVGMLASLLELEGLVVSSATAPLQNVARCVEQASIEIDGFVCAGLASALGVLSEPEKHLGVLLMDIGGGTTDLAWYQDGSAEHVGALPIGGNHFTNDLSVGLGVPFSAAEELKLAFGCAVPANVTDEESVDAGAVTDGQVRKVSRRFMADILEARAIDLFDMATEELRDHGFDGVLPAGVVLTGGSAQLRGIRELAQQVFKMPVRVGYPEGLAGFVDSVSTPAYATAAGLLKWAVSESDEAVGTRPMKRRVGLGFRLKSLIKVFIP